MSKVSKFVPKSLLLIALFLILIITITGVFTVKYLGSRAYNLPTPLAITNTPPVITTKSFPPAYVGKQYKFTYSYYDVNIDDNLNSTLGNVPPWHYNETCSTIVSSTKKTVTCTNYGTPDKVATYYVTLNVDDQKGGKASKTFKIVVTGSGLNIP